MRPGTGLDTVVTKPGIEPQLRRLRPLNLRLEKSKDMCSDESCRLGW